MIPVLTSVVRSKDPNSAMERSKMRLGNGLTGLCQDHPEMKQAEITRLMEEKWGIKYGQSTVCRLIRAWKIPHRVSNRMYENSKLYVEKESVGMIDMEGRDKGELVDTLGIGAVRIRALGQADDDPIVENEVSRSQEESDWLGPERLQGLQSLGIAAIQEQERVNMIMSNETWSNSNAVRVSSQFELPPMLSQHRMVDKFNELLDASNQATEPSTQNQMTYQSSQPGWKY